MAIGASTRTSTALLGRGASLFRTAEGEFTLLAARALEACHRAGVEVVIKSGRRRAQVMEDAPAWASSYIFEVGAGLVVDGEVTFLTGDLQPRDGQGVHEQIAATGGAGAPARPLRRSSRVPRALPPRTGGVARVPRRRGRTRGQQLLQAEGHSGLRLVDNGEIEPGTHVST